jgi:hypothetical protein
MDRHIDIPESLAQIPVMDLQGRRRRPVDAWTRDFVSTLAASPPGYGCHEAL